MKNKIGKYYYGTEYFRYPTPLQGEWEEDFKRMKDLGFNIVKTESAWASMEPKNGVYTWEENDRLVEMCDKYGMAYIPNLQWESAPGWLYRDFDVDRFSPWGLRIPKVTYGMTYVGWLMPCFDNPVTREYCGRFMEKFVERYKGCSNIKAWDVWVEPRSRPGEECACKHSVSSYIRWLETKFGTVDDFNSIYHKRIGCWEDLTPPAASPDYAEMYLWKQWACSSVAERVGWAAEIHRKVDPSRPVMAHVGGCSLIQDPLNDAGDDYLTSKTVDFYGTSFPTPQLSAMDNDDEYYRNIIGAPVINDWIRSHSSYYWNMEVYPGTSYLSRQKTADDVRFDLWSTLAHGAKGIEFWQFKPEQFGYESRSYALTDDDGGFNERCMEAKRFGDFINRHGDLVHKACVPAAGAAIYFDKRSHIIRYLESTRYPEIGKPDFHHTQKDYYREALFGAYHLFYGNNIPVDFVTNHNIEDIKKYRLVYMPMAIVMDERTVRILKDYVSAGGVIIGEVNSAMRGENTLCNRIFPGGGLQELFAVTEYDQKFIHDPACSSVLTLEGCSIKAEMFISKLRPDGSEVILADENGAALISRSSYGSGRAYYIATYLSLAGYGQRECAAAFFGKILEMEGICPEFKVQGDGFITVRRLEAESGDIVFVFNHDRKERKIKLVSDRIKTAANMENGETVEFGKDVINMPPRGVSVFMDSCGAKTSFTGG